METEMTQGHGDTVLCILHSENFGPLATWWRTKLGHQQQRYLPSSPGIIRSQWQKDKHMEHITCDILSVSKLLLPLPWASGLPVAIQCAWNLDSSVHWNATGERIASRQCASNDLPVVFQCVPIMQINTGSPLGNHLVLASASVVPVASQGTCGSSGLPVCSNYAN